MQKHLMIHFRISYLFKNKCPYMQIYVYLHIIYVYMCVHMYGYIFIHIYHKALKTVIDICEDFLNLGGFQTLYFTKSNFTFKIILLIYSHSFKSLTED